MKALCNLIVSSQRDYTVNKKREDEASISSEAFALVSFRQKSRIHRNGFIILAHAPNRKVSAPVKHLGLPAPLLYRSSRR